MTKYNKTALITLIIAIVLVSIVVNIYFLMNNWIKKERQIYLNTGAFQLRENIYNVAIRDGFVIIANSEGQQIKLIIEGE